MKRYLSAVLLIFTFSVVLAGCAGKDLYDNLYNNLNTSKCYVQVSDATENKGKSETTYEYNLTGYDKNGNTKEVKFSEGRKLKKDAYLCVKLKADGEVLSWEEVQKGDLPEKVKEKFEIK